MIGVVGLGAVGRLRDARGAFMVAEPAAEHTEHRVDRERVAARDQRPLAHRAGLNQPAGAPRRQAPAGSRCVVTSSRWGLVAMARCLPAVRAKQQSPG